MLGFIPIFVPVAARIFPLLVGAGAGAATVAACNSSSGKKKAKIARLKARIEALERKP